MPPQATLFYDPHLYDSGWEYTEEDQTYTRHAQTKLKLQPGGLAVPHRMNLFQISGEAQGILDKRAVPPYTHTTMQVIPPQNMQMGKLGKLGADGNLWVALPDGGTPIDVTPHVAKPFYIFGATEQKYRLVHQTLHQALTATNWDRTKVGVGEEVYVGFEPPVPSSPQVLNWFCWDGGLQTNVSWTDAINGASAGGVKWMAPSNEIATLVGVGVPGGSLLFVPFSVLEPSGIDPVHTCIVETNFSDAIFNPGEAGAGMHLHVYMQPTYVSFYRIIMEEVGEDATNVTGYFTNYYPAPSHIGHGADVPFSLNANNMWFYDADLNSYDYCYSPTYPPSSNGNWSPGGSYTWNIPWKWWVADNFGSGCKTNYLASGWRQVFSINPSGTVKITKFNIEWVQRTTSGVITNSR
jgi:hypothetical protein